MSKEIEIELTFLAAKLPKNLSVSESVILEDTYIPEDTDFPPLRLRKKGDKYEITRKMPIVDGDYSQHDEHTIPLDKNSYKVLKKTSNRTVKKRRYFVNIDSQPADVDVFEDAMKGLVLVDFEFKSRKELDEFRAPDVCLVDVTQERTIVGGQLAGISYEDIEPWLNRLGYKKL